MEAVKWDCFSFVQILKMYRLLLLLFTFFLALPPSFCRHHGPYALRISCGARDDIHIPPKNTKWHKDIAYTGGINTNATLPSSISPALTTLRYFPLSEGPENCYSIDKVPNGHYFVRVFLGLVKEPSFDDEPLFDVSIEGSLIYSLQSGWSNHDDERTFVEALLFLTDHSASLCFHSTGHGDPAVLAIEILQVDDKAYNYGPQFGRGTILRTGKRLSCGAQQPKFDADLNGDHWGGNRFWNSFSSFGQHSDHAISTNNSIKQASNAPNSFPEALYQTAIVSTNQSDLSYTMDVDPSRNYSIWLHFAEIDPSIKSTGQRIFNVVINGNIAFKDVDIVNMTANINSALVLNTTVAVVGRSLTITLHPTKGSHAIISGIEIFEVISAESKTMLDEVRALQALKSALGLPRRLGWNGDPCVPQLHPWSGADCQFDEESSKWVIDGLGLDNQGLRGRLPNDMSRLQHLQNINLSGNSIHGTIPSSLGAVASLEILDLSYNFLNGSIPESLGQLTSLRRLNLNGNSLHGRVPAALGGRLLHRASFNFTDNAGLCGIPGLPKCGYHLSVGAKIGIGLGACATFILLLICSTCWWKRRQNILRAQRIAAREAPYAKARTQSLRDVQMIRNHSHGHTRTAVENGPPLLS